jgi:branched-chain amino acid transport system ATP-binding protein
MCRPRILLLDEPSFGIAPIIVDRIFAVIQRLNHEGLTTLLVEQNVSVALDVATRAYVLEGGRIVLSGKTDELSSNEAVREAYLGM